MVELTLARGLDARVGDVQALSFDSQTFDAAVANFMRTTCLTLIALSRSLTACCSLAVA